MSNVLNIKLEEYSTFTKVLTFTKKELQGTSTHPITGAVTERFRRVPLPLTGFTFRAQIKDKFDNPSLLETMEVRIVNAASGRVSISLSKEQTTRIAQSAAAMPTGTGSERVFRIGYYDLVITSTGGESTRIMSGEVYLSRGVSTDPRNSITTANALQLSAITPLADEIILPIDSTAGQNYVGIRYFTGSIQVTPTGGSVDIFRMPKTTNQFTDIAEGTLQGVDAVDELLINGNTTQFKAVASGIQGADSYQLVVSSN